jgi:hypothetical protein
MIDIKQLRELIIKPSLDKLQMYSTDAEELLVFTCACESLGGTYIKQVKGPALGIYQMEPNTYTDIWQNFIKNQGNLVNMLSLNFNVLSMPLPERMIYDLQYATAMARLHYRRVKAPIPDHKNIDAVWEYYKKYYNTPLGKAEKEQSIKHYQKYLKS